MALLLLPHRHAQAVPEPFLRSLFLVRVEATRAVGLPQHHLMKGETMRDALGDGWVGGNVRLRTLQAFVRKTTL